MKKSYLYNVLVIIALLPVLFVSCSKEEQNETPPNNDPETIQINSSGYSKASLQIFAGTTVTWVNNDNIVHTVTASDAKFNSGDIQPGASFNWTFSMAGTFSYYCLYHTGVTGTVTVLQGK